MVSQHVQDFMNLGLETIVERPVIYVVSETFHFFKIFKNTVKSVLTLFLLCMAKVVHHHSLLCTTNSLFMDCYIVEPANLN